MIYVSVMHQIGGSTAHGIGYTGIIVGMVSANERRRYIVTSSLFDWDHSQNDPWVLQKYIPD